MRYKLLGRSGLRVSELCLGTMTFGTEWRWGSDKKESRRVFDAYIEAGGNFIDTANRYTEGTSERMLAEFIGSERDRYVLATKYTLSTDDTDPNASGNHRKNMVRSLEASLERLGTDYIDLYWVHAWDFMSPIEEVMRALDDLVRAGKVLYVGISDTPAWVASAANTMADLRGWNPFVALQIEYSLIIRDAERELLPMARALDLAVTPWAPLGGGTLTGKYLDDSGDVGNRRMDISPSAWRLGEKPQEIAREVVKIAQEIGATPAQVSLAWFRYLDGVIVPIVGARTAEQLKDNLGSLAVELSDEHLERLDKVSAVDLGFPHKFLASEPIRKIVTGGFHDRIDNHRS